MQHSKWPKKLPLLNKEQQRISDDFMEYWHKTLAGQSKYKLIEQFNHRYIIKSLSSRNFLSTLEIGAGLGEHLDYEKLTPAQEKQYVALELRENLAEHIKKRHPRVNTVVGDCQTPLPFDEHFFERILAIHVLEHLPNLPAAIKEMYRVCHKERGHLLIVIPCEGGWAYSLARQLSAKPLFEKRYKQSYQWFISREHINKPEEIFEELHPYFIIKHRNFFPLGVPIIHLNLCIGVTLSPRSCPL